MSPDYYNNTLSSSVESSDNTGTDYAPVNIPKQLNSTLMQTLHTQKNGSIATQAHIPSEPKPIKSHNIETKIEETKVSYNIIITFQTKQAIAQALFSFSPPQNKDPIVSSVPVSSTNLSSSTRCFVPPDETRSATSEVKSQTQNTAHNSALINASANKSIHTTIICHSSQTARSASDTLKVAPTN